MPADFEAEPDPTIEDALAECVQVAECDGWDAADGHASTWPEWEAELRRRLDGLRTIGWLAAGAARPGMEAGDSFGPFELVERLGEGGMGVVWRARQVVLGREVALKLIRPDHLPFDEARERFGREARAAARLRHPGIVAIHDVGTTEGVPWIAMELVSGGTLAEAVGEVGAGEKVELATRLVAEVADALDHAHARGVLHRDVKPSNVLVGPEGHALLIDFGLARGDDVESMTASRALPGSLPYLAPEVLAGRAWSPRSDVYSLGVTYHQLLAGRLPYFASSAPAIMRLIEQGAAPTPGRGLPRDAIRVCRKAMDRDAERRYRSAGDLARDLRNVLARRPVEAGAPGWLMRVVRLAQRRPVAAAVATAMCVFAVVLPLVLLLQEKRHARELGAAWQDEREARALAEAKEATARSALDYAVEVFAVASPWFRGEDEPPLAELLRIGAGRIEERLAAHPAELGTIHLALGRISHHVEDPEAAERHHAAAVESLRSAGAAPLDVARALVGRARSLVELGRQREAAPLLDEVEELEERHPGIAEEIGLARRLVKARAASGRRDHASACRQYDELLTLLAGRGSPEARRQEASILGARGAVELKSGQPEKALVTLEEALVALRRTCGERHPDVALALFDLGLAQKTLERLDDAEASYRAATDLATELWGERSVTAASGAINTSGLCLARGDLEGAERDIAFALSILRVRLDPGHRMLVIARGNHAGIVYRRGRHGDAARLYPGVLEAQRAQFGDEHPFVTASLWNLAVSLERIGRADDARPHFEELTRRGAERKRDSGFAVMAWLHLAQARASAGERDAALALFERGLTFAESAAGPAVGHATRRNLVRGFLAFCEATGLTDRAAELRAK